MAGLALGLLNVRNVGVAVALVDLAEQLGDFEGVAGAHLAVFIQVYVSLPGHRLLHYAVNQLVVVQVQYISCCVQFLPFQLRLKIGELVDFLRNSGTQLGLDMGLQGCDPVIFQFYLPLQFCDYILKLLDCGLSVDFGLVLDLLGSLSEPQGRYSLRQV